MLFLGTTIFHIPFNNFLADTSSIGPTTYYVDPAGDDKNSGTSPDKPIKTIAKVNALYALHPGDSVLFRRGGTFTGTITAKVSGTAAAPITYGAYGEGDKPVISGFTTLSDWKKIDGNIYEASCTGCGSTLNMVTVNGVVQGMGRYPNANDANGGYLKYTGHTATYSGLIDNSLAGGAIATLIDPLLPSTPSWVGAQVVVRKNHGVLDRGTVTAQSAGKLSYVSASAYTPHDNFGYFIQNDIKTLDQQSEWYYNPTTKAVDMYFAGDPSGSTVQVSTAESLLTILVHDYIQVKDLSFQGSNTKALDIRGATGVTLTGISVGFSGMDGVFGNRLTNFSIANSNFDHSNSNAIDCLATCNSTTISGNTIRNTALIAGMGGDGSSTYFGILISGTNNTVSANTIENSGYIGIRFYGAGSLIENNIVNGYDSVKDDGGGIYTGQGDDSLKRIINNTISNGGGAPLGTVVYNYCGHHIAAHGVYLDVGAHNVEISGNTISNSGGGVYLYNAYDSTIKNNTLKNNEVQVLLNHDYYDLVRNVTVSGNTFDSADDTQLSVCALTTGNDISQFGTFTDNNYAHAGGGFSSQYKDDDGKIVNLQSTLAGWQKQYSFDVPATPAPDTATPPTNSDTPTPSGNGGYVSGGGGTTTTVTSPVVSTPTQVFTPLPPVTIPVPPAANLVVPTVASGFWSFLPFISSTPKPAPVITPAAPTLHTNTKTGKKSYDVVSAEYSLNGTIIHTATTYPDDWSLDTATLADGAYTLTSTYHYSDGTDDSTTSSFTVDNSPTILERIVGYIQNLIKK